MPHKIIHIYILLCLQSYNTTSCCIYVTDPNVQVIIATDALVVGIDFPNMEDIINLECKHPNLRKQCKDRVGRPGGDISESCGITYITKATMDIAKKMVEKWPSKASGK